MKGFLVCAVTIALVVVMSVPSLAVHRDAGNMVCSGCHTMHNSQGNASMGGSPTDYLLRGTSSTALCLSCHDNNGSQYATYSATVPVVKDGVGGGFGIDTVGAAGDFAHLHATNDEAADECLGNGHNETGTSVQPAGADTAAIGSFGCTNCHDAHGVLDGSETADVDDYRNLRKIPKNSGEVAGVNITNQQEGVVLTSTVYRLANNIYGLDGVSGSGMSAWCAQCHDNFHGAVNTGDPEPWMRHPTDEDMDSTTVLSSAWGTYNANAEGTYLKLPLQDGAASTVQNTAEEGNEKEDEVFCISCHFAHAGGDAGTGWGDGLRWDNSGGMAANQGCQQCHNK